MAQVLRCCSAQSLNQPYIGVDQKCNENSIFCIQHSPHKNSQGLMHQMLPLKHFKKTLQQKKFKMNQKIDLLIDQYNNLMDQLIQQIRQLKLRKNIELSMLWLRQLAKDEQQYELMRQIYRMDFKQLTCSLIHSIYFKIIHNQILQKKSVKQIDCYKGISQILEHLSQQKQTRSFLSKKISQIQGILQNGQILKRALPDKMVFKQNIKQVLLQSPHSDVMDIKYNKCKLNKSSRPYLSIFSKYPLVPHVVYHINFSTKYTNVMIGACTEALIESSKNLQSKVDISQNQRQLYSNISESTTQFDKHYSKESIVFNCTNGCIYKDGMFQSGSNSLTKGQKQLVLKLRVTATNQIIIMLGKHILCRQNVQKLINKNNQENKLYLHILLRTQGDSFDVDRDKNLSSDQPSYNVYNKNQSHNNQEPKGLLGKSNLNYEEMKQRNQDQVVNINSIKQSILSDKQKSQQNLRKYESGSDLYSDDFNQLNSSRLLGQNSIERIPSVLPQKSSKKINTQAVQNQKVKIQQRRQTQLNSAKGQIVPKGMQQRQKQQKINELIKKQRIDKILNDIKSKPNPASIKDNPIVSKKIKQIQQKNLAKPTPEWRKQMDKVSSSDQFQSYPYTINSPTNFQFQQLKPNNSNSEFIPSSMLKSSEIINPLLIVKKPIVENPTSQNSIPYPSAVGYSNYRIDEISTPNQKRSKLKPQQKSFKLCQDESYDFQEIYSQHIHSPLNGAFTPMDKINDFQFAKKSVNLKTSLNQSSLFKPRFDNADGKNKINYKVQQQSYQNMNSSESFNRNDQSEVIESFQVRHEDDQKPSDRNFKKGQQAIVIPQLKSSHFSKVTSNFPDNSHMESSFGVDNRMVIQRDINTSEKNKNYMQNPMQKMSLLESVINLKSMDESNSKVQIGNVLSPKNPAGKFNYFQQDSSEIIEQSFQS